MTIPDLTVLADAGGWVVAVGVLIGLITLLITGALVPGHVYQREVKRADALDATLETTTVTLGELTRHVDTVIDSALEKRRAR